MKDLSIVTIGKELRTDSRLLSAALDHRHRTILENIDKYNSEMLTIAPLPFETEKGKALVTGGFAKATRYAMLTEDQCYFLLTLMRNNPKVIAAKLALVKAFKSARAQLAQRDFARIEGKQVRAQETESIKALVDYATVQGSQSASRYYANVTKMTNSLLGIEAGQRENLDATQLKQVAIIEGIVDIAIRDGIKADMPYKEVFQLAKMRAGMMVPALGLED
jgi:phage regulator Rha-like protein